MKKLNLFYCIIVLFCSCSMNKTHQDLVIKKAQKVQREMIKVRKKAGRSYH
jgi:hypothetical protein